MRKALPCLFGLLAVPVFAAYTYFLVDTFASGINTTSWQANGTVTGDSTVGLSSAAANGGSVIYKSVITDSVSGDDAAYEARATLKIAATGGTFVLYSHASMDALSGPGAQGSFYAVELTPTVASGGCTMAGSAYKRVGGVVTLLTSWSGACKDGLTVRLMQRNGFFVVATSLDEFWYVAVSGVATGRPGFGARALAAGNGISEARLAKAEYTAPGVISSASMRTALFDTRVDLAWTGVIDDANGSGLLLYQVYRNGVYMGAVRGAYFSDTTVTAGGTYTYALYPTDMYLNSSSQTVTVTTPAAGQRDARRLGVRPLGTYFGAAPENIDLQSGNLSFSLPTITAQGRGGTSVPFKLSYNSQNWRKDPSGTWMLGTDVGFGWGWKMLAGSLTPVYSDWYTIHHYVYTDSSGAEYDLDVNTAGVWRGKTGHFVEFDSATKRLYFPSGNFWEFDCVARGTEMDAGTMYPTRMVDTNGNLIVLRYQGGAHYGGTNGSARVTEVEDVRAPSFTGVPRRTYWFTYNTDAIPHLTAIASELGDGTLFTMRYAANFALADPFTGASFGTATLLHELVIPGGRSFQLYYNTGSQELNQVIMPYGGTLQWVYGAKTLAGNRTQMEVTSRILNAQDGQGNKNYTFTRDDAGDLSRLAHSYTTVQDASGAADKSYTFSTAADWKLGLFTALAERKVVSGTPVSTLRSSTATWTQTANGNPYVSITEEVIDPGVTGVEKASRTEQTVDDYGNLLERKQYGYYTPGGTPVLARTYSYTYLSSVHYMSRWIRNRPVTVKVQKPGGTLMTLLTNTYDSYAGGAVQPVAYPSLLWQHDTANYGSSMIYRGNVTTAATMDKTLYMTFDYTGNVRTTADGYGHTASKVMDENKNYAVPKSATGGSLTSTFSWNGYMALTSAVGPNTDTAGFSYDPYARPSQTTAANGQITTFGYGTAIPYVTTARTGTRWTKTTMDGFGRPVKVEAGYTTNTGVSTTVSVVDTMYAPCACTPVGKLWKTSLPHAPGATAVYWTETLYDALGRTVQVIQPNGSGTTSYSYSGAAVTVTDPAGKWKTQETDALGNLIRVTEPRPGGGTPYDTLYTYSELGKLLTVSMTRPGIGTNPATVTQTRTWVYDAATQRLSSVTHPESGTTSFVYNTDGTVLRKTDAKGQKVEFTYDSDGRVTAKRRYYASGTEDTCGRVDYYYNSQTFDATFTQNAAGRLAATATAAGCGNRWVEMYSYTVAGAVTKKRLRMIAPSVSYVDKDVTYGYGSDGKLATVLYPDNSAPYTYSYDLMDRPIGMTGPAVPGSSTVLNHVTNVTYGVAGQVTGMDYLRTVAVYPQENGPDQYSPYYYTEAKSYNELFQLTRQTHTTGVSTAAEIEYRFSATANNGRIISRKNYVSGEDVSYVYDELNRLISASVTGTGGWGQSFTHDGFGNLWTQAVTKGTAPSVSMSVDMTNNRLNNSGWSYDANGNATTMPMVGGGTATLTYDIENRLVKWGGTEEYAYLADNKRVWKKAPDGTETVYFYGVGGQKLVTYRFDATAGTLVRVSENVYFGGKLIRADGAAVVTDRLGSVVGRYSDTLGTVKKDYFPYGDEIGGSTAGNVDKFGTYHRDQTSGLDYADQRYFAGTLGGRFLSGDPLESSGSRANPTTWNRYPYVNGDPTNLVDVDGRKPFTADNINCVDGYQWGMNFFSNWVGSNGDFTLKTTIGFTGPGGPTSNCYGSGPVLKNSEKAEQALDKVRGEIEKATRLAPDGPFNADHLSCMSGIETGRTWDPTVTRASGGRAGMFQFNQGSWNDSGTSIPWDGGAAAKDPAQAATVALAYLYRNLGRVTNYGNPADATKADIEKAIDRFGENDGHYGAAVMECADQLAKGDFEKAFGAMWNYAQWKSRQP